MNNNTYTKCTTCGRPTVYCKDGCCKSCSEKKSCSCAQKHAGCIRERQPECPYEAVIPSVTVESVSNLKDLADCFVHVSNINTTFYIDDKHRMMVTWAGPVEKKDYDYKSNPLNLRSQFMVDYDNGRIIYYDKTGAINYIADGEYYKTLIAPIIERMISEGEISISLFGEYTAANKNLTLKLGVN